MIELLMAKCELTETEVLEAEKNFIAANPSGVISKEEFVLSMKVTLDSINDTSKLGKNVINHLVIKIFKN